MQGLRCVLGSYDIHGEVTATARTILKRLALNRVPDLVDWVSAADKMSVARLAPAIFEAARQGDEDMLDILRSGAAILAQYTAAVARRLGRTDLPVKLFGGIFAHHLEYGELYRKALEPLLAAPSVELCSDSGALGAAWLAARAATSGPLRVEAQPSSVVTPLLDTAELAAATTEQRNPRSSSLDRLGTPDLVRLFIEEEHFVSRALADSHASICHAVDLVAGSLASGGRLFYVGAGTSGRLGVLDASEIPPTFGASPDLVQGIIAGGAQALHRAVEGAEDQPSMGALAVSERGVKSGDVVCGIAASGRTPFVLGALNRSRELGAKTVLLTCNPARRKLPHPWDVEIDLPTGPELVTGSTRLKAGTATKLVLNILSTCAMIRLGKVRGNLMINVQISNEKLRDRGLRLVRESLGVTQEEAEKKLAAAGWNVSACLANVE
jgi:N-acetylmuramic acid 6-phosphate etherase